MLKVEGFFVFSVFFEVKTFRSVFICVHLPVLRSRLRRMDVHSAVAEASNFAEATMDEMADRPWLKTLDLDR
jgi:hypothetical protein